MRRWVYFYALGIALVTWAVYLTWSERWFVVAAHWEAALTMVFGSFVAGSTPQGGAAVAFPVFTKVLQIPTLDARTFGLIIQSVGMTMAALNIYSRRITVLPKVIVWVSLGGVLGQVIGTLFVKVPDPYPRMLFTFVFAAFGVAMAISRYRLRLPPQTDLPTWSSSMRGVFFVVGIVGGVIASQTGSGADMVTFMLLTLAFSINEKISTPTTVVIMGLNSLVGFFLHGVIVRDIGPEVWEMWLAAVPVVMVGAPLGTVVAAIVHRDVIIRFILLLVTLETLTTLWIIEFTSASAIFSIIVVTIVGFIFTLLIRYRQHTLAKMTTDALHIA